MSSNWDIIEKLNKFDQEEVNAHPKLRAKYHQLIALNTMGTNPERMEELIAEFEREYNQYI